MGRKEIDNLCQMEYDVYRYQKRFWSKGNHPKRRETYQRNITYIEKREQIMAVSIRDVARVAGVSVSTVSRALNGYTDVKEETREKIRETAQFLGYSPNLSARNLSLKTGKNIALLASNLGDEDKMDEFTGNILRGMYGYLNEKNTTVATYGITTWLQEQKPLADFCAEYSLSGVLFMGMKLQDPYLEQAEKLDIPCVSIDVDLPGEKNAVVTSDDVKAFEEITDYLYENGHRRIALVCGQKDAQVRCMRQKGFMRSIQKNGLSIEKSDLLECEFHEEVAYKMVKKYVKKHKKNHATAFACMSDLMALGAVRAINDCGYSVPEDFSVIGFDGIYALEFIKPGITTVDQNIQGKGYMGICTLMKLIEGIEGPHVVYVPHKILYRDSVKKIDPSVQRT